MGFSECLVIHTHTHTHTHEAEMCFQYTLYTASFDTLDLCILGCLYWSHLIVLLPRSVQMPTGLLVDLFYFILRK